MSFTGWSSKRCPGIGSLSRGDREIGVLRNVEPHTRPRLECRRETGLILRCDRKVGNPFQTKQGSRPTCPDQEGQDLQRIHFRKLLIHKNIYSIMLPNFYLKLAAKSITLFKYLELWQTFFLLNCV